jgi:sporulation protein YlmC with PRC-barrel domain
LTGDPVSWLVVEKGWDVVGSDGEELGKVHEVVGDTSNDIFSGLAVSHGPLGLPRKPRFVPSENVREITEGSVKIDLDSATFERLAEHADVAS